MKKIGLALTALILCVVWTASALAASMTATGQGATERDALHAAMREAIEQKVGVLVDSQTYVENYRVIHDRIYTHSEGYIAGYDILRSEYKAGYYEVTIRADVREELLNTDLMSYLQKKAVIRANMQDPRIGVIIVDQNGEEYPSVENTIITGLHKNGFSRIVDLTQIDASVKRRITNAVFDGDYSLSGILDSHFNVDYLVTGYLDMNSDGVPLIDDYPFIGSLNNVAVNLSVRMLNANTGEILYAGSADGQSFNLGPKAVQEALRKATTPIVKELSKSALQKAANPEQHVTILVTGGVLGTMSEAYARISAIPGVSGVYTRVKQAGVMQIDVDYHGTAHDLAQALERDCITIREMTSEYIRI
ncbi:MAG: hypothetical protein IKW79_01365 [Schwartzia sp.]|nr:hypothetical protein [Schwartzia sp. (in: firmicutes)]